MIRRCSAVIAVVATATSFSWSARADEPLVRPYLVEGRLDDGDQALTARLKEHPDDAEARYGLGVVHLLQSVEHLAQGLYGYGLKPESPDLPFVRLPIPENPDPEMLTYDKLRDLLQQFIDDLDRAEQSLSQVNSPEVKLMLPVGLIRLDVNGNGRSEEDETFWKIFTTVAWRGAQLTAQQQEFAVGFDAADAHWMIGYTHLLRALAHAWLAYDTEQFFAQTAPFFFAGARDPYAQLQRHGNQPFDVNQIADLIAAIHLMNFEPQERDRMPRARQHLLGMIRESREFWKLAAAEADDDREWIPNARQTSLTPLRVTDERIMGWLAFLDEAEQVLEGKKLIRHWRVAGEQGINLKRVFEEPSRFDLVLWAHGAAAIPYLEEGPTVSQETGNMLTRVFSGDFLMFAVWVN
jgi:hypothetical protein